MKDKLVIYKYTRGDDYSVSAVVNELEAITFFDVIVPEGVSNDIQEKFLDDAERSIKSAMYKSEYYSQTYGHGYYD